MVGFEILAITLVAFIGITSFFIGWWLNARSGQNKIASAEERAKKIISDAERDAASVHKEKLLEVKDEWYRKKHEFETESTVTKNRIEEIQKQLKERESSVESKMDILQKKEKEAFVLKKQLEERQHIIAQKETELHQMREEEVQRLERASGLLRDDAKRELMNTLLITARESVAEQLKGIREEFKLNARREAQKLLLHAIQRTGSDHAVESSITVVNLASDDIKGRIIGKEGRNIRAFEAATGVDLVIDDMPEAVLLSSFDPMRREIAKISLERLLSDGRIQPVRIEEVVKKVEAELDEEILRVGESAFAEIGSPNAHPDLVKLVGQMKYRLSYGQNLLSHSLEVAHLAGILAAELGFDVNFARRSGLLHDIGKVMDKTLEGTHALVGGEFAKKCGEHPIVVNAICSHHDEIPMESTIAPLVQTCDAMSGARPGARRESVENYVKRLEKLEKLILSFNGVQKTFALQAGREVRVIVESEKINDVMADQLASDIAKKIYDNLEYSGQIKVTVLRERRSIAIAN